MKIGVISDTHHNRTVYPLPPPIKKAFAKLDLIIHVGDITQPSVIKELEKIAPVKTVQGNKKGDKKNFKKKLPKQIIFSVNDIKLAVIHCPGRFKKKFFHCLSLLGLQSLSDHLLTHVLLSYFKKRGKIDCIIFGDTHRPFCKKINNTLFLNPGAAYTTSKRPGSILVINIDKSNSIDIELIYFFS